jgi:hypothetical protein
VQVEEPKLKSQIRVSPIKSIRLRRQEHRKLQLIKLDFLSVSWLLEVVPVEDQMQPVVVLVVS